MRTVVRYAGIALAGIVVFVFALQMTLPVDRAKDKVIEALSPSYDVSIGRVERGFVPGRVYVYALSLRTRATRPDEQPTTFFIDRLQVDVGIFALMRGNLSVDFDARLEPNNKDAHLAGNITLKGFGKRGYVVHAGGHGVPGDDLPLRALIGLPMTGKLDIDVALDLPVEARGGKLATNWQKADGTFDFGCPSGCTFGDGKTKLKPILKNHSQQAIVADGIDFGKVIMDSIDAHADIKGGTMTVTKFDSKTNDGEIHVDYAMKLEPDIMDSMVTGCLRFKGSDALLKRDRKTYDAINLSGAERREDGLFHISLTDRLRDMKRLNLECGPNVHHQAPPEGAPHVTLRPTMPTPPPPSEEPRPGSGVVAPVERLEPGGEHLARPLRPGGPAGGAPPPPPEGSAMGSAGSAEGSAEPEGSGSENPALKNME
ncbi:MAG TPA: type II secretion system protein GspN [Kofleriaceae bacterium]|jgi:type II secretion system protein N